MRMCEVIFSLELDKKEEEEEEEVYTVPPMRSCKCLLLFKERQLELVLLVLHDYEDLSLFR
jgi:hypothetical protein